MHTHTHTHTHIHTHTHTHTRSCQEVKEPESFCMQALDSVRFMLCVRVCVCVCVCVCVHHHVQQVWAMCTMVVGGFFLSFCFGRIASIVGRLDAVRAARAEQIESITQFLKDHELPKPLSRK